MYLFLLKKQFNIQMMNKLLLLLFFITAAGI